MIKTIALINRIDGISHEEFAMHYEEIHAPLALKHLKSIKSYTRNHVVSALVKAKLPFDCVTQFWFETIEDAIKVQEFSQSAEGQVVRDDEMKFLDRAKTLAFLVEERSSDLEASFIPSETVKAIAIIKRKPDITRDQFIDHYEYEHAPLIMQHSKGLFSYKRNYVLPMGDEPQFDSLTELWFRDKESYDDTMAFRLSASGRVIADDEATFIDTDNIGFYLVNEYVSVM